MSGKLDKSLDDILKTQQTTRNRTRRSGKTGKPNGAAAAPVGGVKKTTKAAKPAVKTTLPTGPSGSGEGKIIVSNLPRDVNESMMKDYFNTSFGGVKKVLMTYGPDGLSRGICTIIFHKRESASKAAKEMNGVKLDQKPMRVEVVLGAAEVPEVAGAKSLKDRISQPAKNAKAQPKPVTGPKSAAGAKKGKGKAEKAPRPRKTKKTAEELDAEMADYFVANPSGGDAANGGAVQPAASGDVGMDEIQ